MKFSNCKESNKMAYASILQDLQELSDECDKTFSSENNENCSRRCLPLTKPVKEFFNLVNQVEKELNLPVSKIPVVLTGLVNNSERKAFEILTGKSKSALYKGPIFANTDIYQPNGIQYKYQGKTRTYNPDFQIGNMIIEIKCCGVVQNNLREIKAKHNTASKLHPFQMWLFDKDDGDLIDIITYINGTSYHINGYQFSTFQEIETANLWKEWICKTPYLKQAKKLEEFFRQHTSSK